MGILVVLPRGVWLLNIYNDIVIDKNLELALIRLISDQKSLSNQLEKNDAIMAANLSLSKLSKETLRHF